MNIREYNKLILHDFLKRPEEIKAKCENKKCGWEGVTGDMMIGFLGGWICCKCPVCYSSVEY